MNFTLTGNVVKADLVAPFAESTGQSAAREAVVSGNTSNGFPPEVVLRVQNDATPEAFDPLGQIALGSQIVVEVTTP